MDPRQVENLAAEIRESLLESVPSTDGKLMPGLDVVELTLALLRVFNPPRDHILWGAGRHAHVNRLVAGRSGRTPGPPNGFAHDAIESSQCWTALSWADGMTSARHIRGLREDTVVAVIGSAALNEALAWEALRLLGATPQRPVVVVLNDESRAPGTDYRMVSRRTDTSRDARQVRFERTGIMYLGPVDGHDTTALEAKLRNAVKLDRPVVLHCVTDRGRGRPEIAAPPRSGLHSAGPTHLLSRKHRIARSDWVSAFDQALAGLGTTYPDLVAVAAGSGEPFGLRGFMERFPERVVDAGPAQQHVVGAAAGLALGGAHPVVAIDAGHLNRVFDQALLEVALHHAPVTFALHHAGATGNSRSSDKGRVGPVFPKPDTGPTCGRTTRHSLSAIGAARSRRPSARADRAPFSQ
ncbi:1-deoxy-D-xylulose-5-phosphate synthase N-terminal domain-containing protein [Kitasatospora sp. NPDC001603]|uniref:1-deoxy-D-xylulose-5-phosphate synthase N-terminal domain-containing protein n=1 Tax=Kitasatospora sp. NPDC001603 TaxID=3154388 RepID=UPI0033340B73